MYHKNPIPVRFVKENTAQCVNSDLANYVQISNVGDITMHSVKTRQY